MFLVIIIIILGACASIVGSMYYNTIAMQRTYGAVNGYYGAYYGAMASVERGLLMSKIKYPTYAGRGGFKGGESIGSPSNTFSGDFRKLTQGENSMTWEINSKTTEIDGTIDTKTLRVISFEKYNDGDLSGFTEGQLIENGAHGIASGLRFYGTTRPVSPNVEVNTNIGKSTDFNRFFALNDEEYIVRGLNTTDRYNQVEEGEKDYQLTGEFNFTGGSTNPRPALSGLHKE